MGLFSKIKDGLKKTRETIVNQIDNMLSSFKKIDDELFEELEELLIMGDVGATIAQDICEILKDRVKKEKVQDPNQIHNMLAEITADMLTGNNELVLNTKPSIILVIGVNGVG